MDSLTINDAWLYMDTDLGLSICPSGVTTQRVGSPQTFKLDCNLDVLKNVLLHNKCVR